MLFAQLKTHLTVYIMEIQTYPVCICSKWLLNELWMLNELWNISKIKNCITPQTLLLLRISCIDVELNCIIGKHENISLWTPKKIAFHYELKKKAAEIEYASLLLLGPSSQCLKIIKKVAFWFSPIFVILKLTCLVILFDRKFQVYKKSRRNGPFLAFLINFCLLKM